MTLKTFYVPALLIVAVPLLATAQATLGGITGSVLDSTGAVVPTAAVAIKNVDTNLERRRLTLQWILPGSEPARWATYSVSFSKEGFKTETHTAIIVRGRPHHHGERKAGSRHGGDHCRSHRNAAHECRRYDQRVRARRSGHQQYSARHGQFHSARDSESGSERRFHEHLRQQRGFRQPGDLGKWPARHQQQLLGERSHGRQCLQRQVHESGGVFAVHAEHRPKQCGGRRHADQHFGIRFGRTSAWRLRRSKPCRNSA